MLAARHHRRPRTAFTLLEMLMVIAVILILGAVLVPALVGMWSNNRTKAGADMAVARLADARGAAISHARPYRVSMLVTPDGLCQIRVAPDESEQAEQPAADEPVATLTRVDTLPTGVVFTPKSEGTPHTDGWTTLVIFLPDGTCSEASEFWVEEPAHPDITPLIVRVRALTGVTTVNPSTAPGGSSP